MSNCGVWYSWGAVWDVDCRPLVKSRYSIAALHVEDRKEEKKVVPGYMHAIQQQAYPAALTRGNRQVGLGITRQGACPVQSTEALWVEADSTGPHVDLDLPTA